MWILENLKLKYFLEKTTLCDVWKLFSYVFIWRWRSKDSTVLKFERCKHRYIYILLRKSLHGHLSVYVGMDTHYSHVYIYMYVYVCIYAISVYTFRHVYKQIYLSLYSQTCLNVQTYYIHAYNTYIHICIYVYIHVDLHIWTFMCMYVHKYMTPIHMMNVGICMYICYMYVYI